MTIKRIVPFVGGDGHRSVIGEDHHSAKLTDAHVELMRRIYEQKAGGYRKIAKFFLETYNIEVHWVTVRDIVKYRRRACTPDGYMTIRKELPVREPLTSRAVLEVFLKGDDQ